MNEVNVRNWDIGVCYLMDGEYVLMHDKFEADSKENAILQAKEKLGKFAVHPNELMILSVGSRECKIKIIYE